MFDFLDLYPWALPLVIFMGRICDVSLGTLRIVFVSKGEKRLAPLIGFVEVFIWVVIIAQILSRANSLPSYLAYAAGYAAGTFIGLHLEARIGLGFVSIRVFTLKDGPELVKHLHSGGFGSTLVHGAGSSTEIDIVESVVSRKDAPKAEALIKKFDQNAFYLVEDVRSKQKGIFTPKQSLSLMKSK
ncbi:MAG: DUF5698 domain-containing protein [Deltaproteobacteria bacterium]|jgi:uncharacterized protein YebE (UPF0316 family)|nr:DUF5698 domain-containing protein [Deltaproteobacteria bacterium]